MTSSDEQMDETGQWARAAESRYADLYRHARIAIGIGGVARTVGAVLSILIAALCLVVGLSGGESSALAGLVGGAFCGGLVYTFFYIWGMMAASLGQQLLATADTAVYACPFLSIQGKAATVFAKSRASAAQARVHGSAQAGGQGRVLTPTRSGQENCSACGKAFRSEHLAELQGGGLICEYCR